MKDTRSPAVVFVYGTLLSGLPNHAVLGHATYLGRARTTARYTLVDMGAFPALVDGGKCSIVGELYELDPGTLELIDEYEDHPSYYRRSSVRLEDGRDVCAYFLPPKLALGSPPIPSGDWRAHARPA